MVLTRRVIIVDRGETLKMQGKVNSQLQEDLKCKWRVWFLLIMAFLAASRSCLVHAGPVLRNLPQDGKHEFGTQVAVDMEDLGDINEQQGPVTYMAGEGSPNTREEDHGESATETNPAGDDPHDGEENASTPEKNANEDAAQKNEDAVTVQEEVNETPDAGEQQTASMSSCAITSEADQNGANDNEVQTTELPASTATYLAISSTETAAEAQETLTSSTSTDQSVAENQAVAETTSLAAELNDAHQQQQTSVDEVKEDVGQTEEAAVGEMAEEAHAATYCETCQENNNAEGVNEQELAQFEALLNATGPLQQMNEYNKPSAGMDMPRKRTKRIKRDDQDKKQAAMIMNGSDSNPQTEQQQASDLTQGEQPSGNTTHTVWGYEIPPKPTI